MAVAAERSAVGSQPRSDRVPALIRAGGNGPTRWRTFSSVLVRTVSRGAEVLRLHTTSAEGSCFSGQQWGG